MPSAQIKDEKQYQALRRDGASKEKAARIANASANSSRSATGRKGGQSSSYDDWSKSDLVEVPHPLVSPRDRHRRLCHGLAPFRSAVHWRQDRAIC